MPLLETVFIAFLSMTPVDMTGNPTDQSALNIGLINELLVFDSYGECQSHIATESAKINQQTSGNVDVDGKCLKVTRIVPEN